MKRLLSALLVLSLPAMVSAINVGGTISSNTTWYKADTPHRVTSAITVNSGVTLTLQPGVQVLFDADVAFNVEGLLNGIGIQTDSIFFEAGTATEWLGIKLINGGDITLAFTRISDGDADGAANPDWHGGAIHATSGSVISMTDCVVRNCTAANATTGGYGGAIMGNGCSAMTLVRCLFENNSAKSHGAVSLNSISGTNTITNCIFRNNSTTNTTYSYNSSAITAWHSTAIVTGCLFENNSGYFGTVASVTSGGTTDLTVDRCTFSGNTATNGGVLRAYYANANLTVKNSIVWGNNTTAVSVDGGAATITYSDIEGSYTGTGNINSDPLFVANDDYNLQTGSPCIDTGDPSDLDLDGTTADMGAFPTMQYGGTISGNTTWYAADTPHHVTSSISIGSGATLTLEPGVHVVFDANVQISVSGSLVAQGTETDSVIFEKGASAQWTGISSYGTVNLAYTRISNTSKTNGGAVYSASVGSNVTLTNCVLSNNWANSNGGAIYFSSGSLTLNKCRFEGNGGNSGGAIYNAPYAPTSNITDCIFESNYSTSTNYAYGGGAIFVYQSSSNITGCLFISNSSVSGGAVNVTSASTSAWATIDRCTFSGNYSASYGGAIRAYSNGPAVTVNLKNSILWANTNTEISTAGGATVNATYTTVTGGYSGVGILTSDPLFVGAGDYSLQRTSPARDAGDPAETDPDNSSRRDQGAYPFFLTVSGSPWYDTWTSSDSPVHVTGDITIGAENTLYIDPGVTVLMDADATFNMTGDLQAIGTQTDSIIFKPGAAAQWGGIRFTSWTALTNQLHYCRVTGAYNGGSGGGVYGTNSNTTIEIQNSVIRGNTAYQHGGGVYINNGADANISETIIADNHATQSGAADGGGVYANGSGTVLTMTDCEVYGNTAAAQGGGFCFGSYGTMTLTRCLIRDNHSYYGGGMNVYSSLTVTLENCTVADNTAGASSSSAFFIYSSVTLHNCIVWNNNINGTISATYCDLPTTVAGTGNISTNPLFVGGDDFSLLSTSPCIDVGDPAEQDADHSRIDMGAFPTTQNTVYGTITSQTWTQGNSPYRVVEPVTLSASNILTIEPGVDVLFDVDVAFTISGSMNAAGTESDSIRFLPGRATEWHSIRIVDATDSSTIRYARISGASANGTNLDGGGLYVAGATSKVGLSHTVIRDCYAADDGAAINVATSGTATLDTCRIINNTAASSGGGLYLSGGGHDPRCWDAHRKQHGNGRRRRSVSPLGFRQCNVRPVYVLREYVGVW